MTRIDTPTVWYRIYGDLLKETAKAYLWKLPSDQKEFWMPISQCRNLQLIPDEDGNISVEVKEWILDEKAVPPSQRYDLEHPGPAAQQHRAPLDDNKWIDDLDDDIPF